MIRMKTSFNKYLYIGFVLFGLYQICIKHSALEAATQLGIALIFDPFDATQPWKERPQWQKIVLIIHLALIGGLFGYEVGYDDFLKGMEDGWNGK
jgi:H+/Cl- antiporter ClcA